MRGEGKLTDPGHGLDAEALVGDAARRKVDEKVEQGKGVFERKLEEKLQQGL